MLVLLMALGCAETDDDGVVADTGDGCEVSGNLCTWAGVPGEAAFSDEGGDKLDTALYFPMDVVFAPDGTAYVSDWSNHRILRIDTDGTVWTVSGTGMLGDGPEGDAMAAAWNHPVGLALSPTDPEGLYVAAWHNSRVNRIDLFAGTVEWYIGTGGRQYGEGHREEAILDLPSSVAFDAQGTLYVSDQANHVIRYVDTAGQVRLLAGEPRVQGYDGDGGPALEAHLKGDTHSKTRVTSRIEIHGEALYVADTQNQVIRYVDLDSGIIDRVAGVHLPAGTYAGMPNGGVPGFVDAEDPLEAQFSDPLDVAVGPDGSVYIADTGNHCVRRIDPDGVLSTFAGTCTEGGFAGDGGPADEALLDEPHGVTVGPDGAVFVVDSQNHVIRRVAP